MFVSVKGKVVLIFGGSSGIGKALANRFCKESAAVVATYFSTKTNEVAEMLEDNFRYCDIRHPSELNSVCEYIMKLIAFVGMDGVGKTSILNSIYSILVERGKKVAKIKPESGDTEIAKVLRMIRDTYSQKDKQQQRELNQKIAEALALDLLKTSEKIKEAYSSFDYVLVDRWTMCQEVYDKTWFVWNDFINECLALCYKPDIVFLISAEMDIVQRRLSSRPVVKETENIFSLKRVNRLYHNLAKENGWEVIENNKTLDDAVSKVYQKLLEEPSV